MVLSKRERYIAIAVVAVLALLGLDRFFVSPLLARLAELDVKVGEAQRELDEAQRLFARSGNLRKKWAEMGGKSLKATQSEAEGQLLNSVGEWARRSGMNLASVKPERTEKDRGFLRMTYRATGTGGVSQIRDFLISVQTAAIPVSITDLQVNTRKEGSDDLSVLMSIATISQLPPEAEKPAAKPAREN